MSTLKMPSIGTLVGGVIAIAFVVAVATPIVSTSGTEGTFWGFISQNWLWGMLIVVALQFGVGLWQQRKNHSYSGDAMYYLLGGGALILGLAVILFGVDLVQSALTQGREGNQAWLQGHVDSGNAPTSIIKNTDWWTVIGVAAFIGGVGVAIASLVQSKTVRLIVAIPFLVFGVIVGLTAGYDAAPERFKETLDSVVSVIPLVDTPLEQQAEADAATASVLVAATNLAEQNRLREAAIREANRVKIEPCTGVYAQAQSEGRISDCELVTMRADGDPHRRDADSTWCVISPPAMRQINVDETGPDDVPNGIPEAYVLSAKAGVATGHVYNLIAGKTFQRETC